MNVSVLGLPDHCKNRHARGGRAISYDDRHARYRRLASIVRVERPRLDLETGNDATGHEALP